MATHPIQFHNRYTGRTEAEAVYGDAWLRWTYENPLGRLCLHALVKRSLFSRWYGWRMDRPASRAKVASFIRDFQIDTSELADPPDSYRTFNEFFHRRLKPEARPIDPSPDTAVFPADGRHLCFPDLAQADGFLVKGRKFSLRALLRDGDLAERFENGSLIMSRLCPVDYHRFHFPVAGTASTPRLINGPLYSVNPIALRRNIEIFSENKRLVSRIESERFGTVVMIEVGATCVGGIEYTFTPDRTVGKGAEKGYFKFGGSSVLTLFEPARLQLDPDLVRHSSQYLEVYARMGDRMGQLAGKHSATATA